MLAVFILLGLAYTQQVKAHVGVSIMTSRLRHPAQLILKIITTLISLFIFSILAWQGSVVGIEERTVSDMLRVPQYPFRLLVAVAAFLVCLELLIDLGESVKKLAGEVILMDPVTVGILGSCLLFIFLLIGIPIAFSLMLVGFLGTTYLASLNAALPMVARTVYESASHYPYTIIPLFIVMGSYAEITGISSDLYDTFDKWLRRATGRSWDGNHCIHCRLFRYFRFVGCLFSRLWKSGLS